MTQTKTTAAKPAKAPAKPAKSPAKPAKAPPAETPVKKASPKKRPPCGRS